MAALSIVATGNDGTHAQVLGDVSEDNAGWFAAHLRELEGDVILDCHQSSFIDPAALMLLVDFEEFLRRRGNRLMIDGVPNGGPACSPATKRA